MKSSQEKKLLYKQNIFRTHLSGLFFMLCNLLYISSQAQGVSGTVTDDSGEAVVGVSVVVKGSTYGVVTGADGYYNINAQQGSTLMFTSIGYASQEVFVNNNVIDVVLHEDAQNVDEVLIVAYGTTKKNTFTGALSVVDNNRLNTAQVSNVGSALQGTAAGVQVISETGQPGSNATIRIRGVGSINSSNTPLFVVDGVPFDGDLSSLNPSDIESMVVLKDAASAALYGSRAGNGVVLIATKTGGYDRSPKINIRATAGISQRAVKPLKLLNTNDWMELRWETLRNGYLDNGGYDETSAAQKATKELIADIGINPYGIYFPEPVGVDGKLIDDLKPLWNDDWDKALIGTGARYEVNASVSGGSKSTQYFISTGHLNEKGVTLGSGFIRTSVRSNLTNQTTSWLKTFLNLSYSNSQTSFNDSQDSNVGNALTYGMNMPSFYPIYKRNPVTGEYIKDTGGNKIYDFGPYRTSSYATNNQIASLPISKNQSKRDLVSVRGSLEFDFSKMAISLSILEGLKFKTSYSRDLSIRGNHTYSPAFIEQNVIGLDGHKEVVQNLENTSASRSTLNVSSYTFNNILSYNKEFYKDHQISLMIGQEIYEYNREYNGGTRKTFPLPGIQEPDAAAIVSGFNGYSDKATLAGFFGRAEYHYKKKYNISGSYRKDGSSRFHKNNRWGDFWSVGLAWNMEQEFFLKNVKMINLLKLRASYGAQGNQEVSGFYPYQSNYTSGSVGQTLGLYISTLSNPNLTWETNLNLNFGVDFALFHHRLRGSIEYFERASKDLIYNLDLPPSSGYPSVISNVGAMKNNGVEAELKGTLYSNKDIAVDLGMNIAHYRNRITSFPVKEGLQSGTKFIAEGRDYYAFRLVEWAGNTTVGEQLYDRRNGQIVETGTAKGGEPSWYLFDDKGKQYKTTQYNTASLSDRRDFGSALPTIYGGINLDVKIYDFTLSALFSYSLGNKLYATDFLMNYSYGNAKGRPLAQEMINRWTPENTKTDLPRLTTATINNNFSSQSSRHLYDGSYGRLKNVTLTYNLPTKIINKAKMSNASIFVQGENLLTFFGVEGVDPEAGGIGGTTSFRYPAVKTTSVGLNITF